MTRWTSVFLLCASLSGVARAERPWVVARHVSEAKAQLAAADPARVEAAIERLGTLRTQAAVDALAAFVREGQTDSTADRALVALGATNNPHALAVLSEFTRHRRASARRLAYRAIAAVQHDSVPSLLARGLRDSDAGVRAIAATSMGELGAVEQIDLLFHALVRGVPEAAVAIATLGNEEALARYHGHVGTLPIHVMLSGYRVFLQRDDLPEAARLDTVARLGEVAGPAVKSFLSQLLTTSDWNGASRLRQAVADTARRIDLRARPGPEGSK